jgi:tRNA(Ile)-lysidine synthase
MSLVIAFEKYIYTQHLFSKKDKLLLAVSGGVDSVVLCELCKQCSYDFVILHCNFRLRGEESERDEAFVRQLAEHYSVSYFIQRFDTEVYAAKNKLSIQVAARTLRYKWFEEIRQSLPTQPSYILTAHHQDDNVETSLMNFFKGTGIAGLRGIQAKQNNLIRPLLFANKKDILAFANEHKLNCVEDSSNSLDKYSRNYFRNQVLPLVKTIYPEAEANLADNLQRFAETEQLYQQAIAQHKKQLLEYKGNEIHIPVLKLKKTVPLQTVLYEIVKEAAFTPQQLPDIISLLDSDTGKYVQSATHRIIKNRNWLLLAPLATEQTAIVVIDKPGSIEFALGCLHLHPQSNNQQITTNELRTTILNADSITYPIILRKWKTGDYFYPLGMKKKKKVSRFLIDQKLSKTEKEKVWVLEMDKKIIWVVGQRIDDRFKVTDTTTTLLKIHYAQTE